MEKFIKEIIKNKTHCFFVSPHLDDAVLSAGELLSQLAGKTSVTVINVFTDATLDSPTLSARQFLKYSGYSDASSLFAQRRKEDELVLKYLGIKSVNLGYIEALWRRKTDSLSLTLGRILPEFAHVYPIYRFLVTSSRVAKADSSVKSALQKKLQMLIGDEKNTIVFCPLGVGGHVDHWLVREVCESTFATNLVYWSDFPYNERVGSVGNAPVGYKETHLPVARQKKEKLIRIYTSQVSGLFPGEIIPVHKEIYFIPDIRRRIQG
jgi:LmbE family N-acetylglucosaminyl deacetylase